MFVDVNVCESACAVPHHYRKIKRDEFEQSGFFMSRMAFIRCVRHIHLAMCTKCTYIWIHLKPEANFIASTRALINQFKCFTRWNTADMDIAFWKFTFTSLFDFMRTYETLKQSIRWWLSSSLSFGCHCLYLVMLVAYKNSTFTQFNAIVNIRRSVPCMYVPYTSVRVINKSLWNFNAE